MKNITILSLAAVAVVLIIYVGIDALSHHYSYGPFFTFVGTCTAIGLTIDIGKHIRERIRQSNIRKLG